MDESKKRICKYPKCQKEIPGEKGVFCSHHKKSVKEKGKAVGKGTAAVVGTAGAILLAVVSKKISQEKGARYSMTCWIGPCNPNYYDVRGALAQFNNEVDWTKGINIEIGDIFYIYESKTSKRIIAKLEVIDNKVTDKNRLADDVFWKEEVKISKTGYFRMKLITMFDEGMDRLWLQNNGLKSNLQSPERINPELLGSILDWELDNDIKNNESSSELTTLMIDTEGKRIGYYTYRYERNSKLRQAAIDYHGLNCACCEFNFGKIYGEIGKDFIEVHHIKPISSFTDEEIVNPITDLIPLCSNCHRMIHRRKGKVFTVEELKNVKKIVGG